MSDINSALKKYRYHYIIIVAYALVTHGLLLLNDGVYWDDWLLHTNWSNLYSLFAGSGGIPTTAYFHWLMGYLPHTIFCYKLVAFLSITFSGILVYSICNELKFTSRTESLFVALLSLSYPAFQVSMASINTPSPFYYFVFLLACFLALRSERKSGVPRYSLRVGALALWFLSFTVNSLLVFYYGFLLVLILQAKQSQNMSVKHVFTKFLLRRLDYVLLPVLYWVVARVFFPHYGLNSDENQFSLSLLGITSVYETFIKNAIYAQTSIAVKNMLVYPTIFLSLGLLAVIWICSIILSRTRNLPSPKVATRTFLFFGVVLLALGIFPYAAVGKAASVHEWETRHALLVALPMAVIFVGLTRPLLANKSAYLSRLGLLCLMILLLAFTLSSISNYFSWQARWVKDQSIMQNLAMTENADEISVFWVDDQFQVGGDRLYRFYEWASIFKSVWGNESHIGLDPSFHTSDFLTNGKRYFIESYNLSEFDPNGCQGILTIRAGASSNVSIFSMSTKYLYYRFFNRDMLEPYLKEVTDLEIQRIEAPEATNCLEQMSK